MSHRIITGTAAALVLVAALAAGSLPARAEEPEACATPRFSDVGWTDISATTAVAGLILKNLGYTPKVDILSVAVTYEALPRGDVDIFLGNWMPLQVPTQKPLVDAGKIEVPRVNLEGAIIGFAVPKAAFDAGLKTYADIAKFGILIARTRSDVSKHRGISYFIIPMDLPGIEIRPIRNMTGGAGFNEVFFTDVRVPAENLIGDENLGWGMAKSTLANERVSLSTGGGLQWGYGPSARDLVQQVKATGGVGDQVLRQRLMDAYIEGEILRFHRMRMISAAVNKKPGPDASLRKALADPHGKRVFGLAKDVMGANGMLADTGTLGPEWDQWVRGFLFSPALTVGGGTSEVLRNIIGERLLGLPHDHDVEQGKTWSESRA